MYKIIEPVIELELKPISNLSKDVQKFICNCEPKCKRFIILEKHGRFCEKNAKEIALGIFSLIEGIQRVESSNKARGWTYKEDQFIKDWYKGKNGVAEYGDIRIIATMLNRPISRTRAHIKYMKRMKRI